jgi:uncharacterized protein YndB with AHSA1/START domain
MSSTLDDRTTTHSSRSAAITLPLNAAVEAVWQALTDPQELVHWFPTNAAVDPRPGGTFVISWDGAWQWEMTITDFEPRKRFRMLDRLARPFDANGRPLGNEPPVELALEITLEPSTRGGTVLRLVHSGFGHGDRWDDELDGVTLGWNVELRTLRHYLTRHLGRRRHTAHVHVASPRALGELWAALTAPSGLIAGGYRPDFIEGDRCALRLATGDLMEGSIAFAQRGRQLLVAADELGDGLFRLSLDRAAGEALVQVWVSSWTMSLAALQARRDRLRPVVERIVAGA